MAQVLEQKLAGGKVKIGSLGKNEVGIKSELKEWIEKFNKYVELLKIYRRQDLLGDVTKIYGKTPTNRIQVRAENKEVFDLIIEDEGIVSTRKVFKKTTKPNMEAYLLAMLSYFKILENQIKSKKTGLTYEKKLISRNKKGITARYKRSRQFRSLEDIVLLLKDYLNHGKTRPTKHKEEWEKIPKILDKIKEMQNNEKEMQKKMKHNKKITTKYLQRTYEMLSYLLGIDKATEILFEKTRGKERKEILKNSKKVQKYGFFQLGEIQSITNRPLKKKYTNITNAEELWLTLFYVCKDIEKKATQQFKEIGNIILAENIIQITEDKKYKDTINYKEIKQKTEDFIKYLQKTISL